MNQRRRIQDRRCVLWK